MLINFLRLWLFTFFRLPFSLLKAIPAEGLNNIFKRLILFILLWLLFNILNLLHLVGFLLDELLFSGYRRTSIKKPVFILGIPRSGTTHLQRLIAQDKQFTTLQTWEVLLAPSITERYLYRFIGLILSPFSFLAAKLRKMLFHSMDDVHYLGLLEPEEDFFLFFWIDYCFLMAFVCPNSKRYWKLGQFGSFTDKQKQGVMTYYEQCLKKHLYFHDRGKQLKLLSKNPSFTSMLPTLRETFKDAIFVACHREPEKVVPSQLSSLGPGLKLLGSEKPNSKIQENLLKTLQHYYQALGDNLGASDVVFLPMKAIQKHAELSVRLIYSQATMALSSDFNQLLSALNTKSKEYKTKHRYSLADFNLDEQSIQKLFPDYNQLTMTNPPFADEENNI